MKTTTVTAVLEPLPTRTHLRLLICGDHDVARATFATSFPNPIIIDASGALRADDNTPDVPILRTSDPEQIEKLVENIKNGLVAPDTLVLDSFPFVSDAIDQAVEHIKGYDNYAAKCARMTRLMTALASLPCHIVITTRVKQEMAKPGQVYGGKLVTDMDRIILGTTPDAHKTLLEHVDLVFEIVRGTSGRSMAAVKISALPEFESDEVILPEAKNVLTRFPTMALRVPTPTGPPSAEQYGAYARLRKAAGAAGLTRDTLKAIRACAGVNAGGGIAFLNAEQIVNINERLTLFLAGSDPLVTALAQDATSPVASIQTAPTINEKAGATTELASVETANAEPAAANEASSDAAAAGSQEAEAQTIVSEEQTSPQTQHAEETVAAETPVEVSDTPAEPATTIADNVVSITSKVDETPEVPSGQKAEWREVKSLLNSLNTLLERANRKPECHNTVLAYLKAHEIYAGTTPNGLLLCTAAHAAMASEKLRAHIAELTPLELPVAS